MKLNVRWMIACSCLAWMLACGDDGDGELGGSEGGRGGKASGAPAKCRAFAQAICEKWADCGQIDEDEIADCRDEVENSEGSTCDDAVQVSRSYDQCLRDIRREECSEELGDELEAPESCEEVVLVR